MTGGPWRQEAHLECLLHGTAPSTHLRAPTVGGTSAAPFTPAHQQENAKGVLALCPRARWGLRAVCWWVGTGLETLQGSEWTVQPALMGQGWRPAWGWRGGPCVLIKDGLLYTQIDPGRWSGLETSTREFP